MDKFEEVGLVEIPRWLLSPFPRRRGLLFAIRLFKSFEVLFFKILNFFGQVEFEKTIIGIPSLALKGSVQLQAVVYNGTKEEILGFKPRGWLHRLLRGLPNTALIEHVQFLLTNNAGRKYLAKASTDVRGFIQVSMPWKLDENSRYLWSELSSLGVATFFGRINLGQYHMEHLPIHVLHSGIENILISDIDDTIKDTQIAHATSPREMLRGLIRGGYYRYEAISGMPEYYQQLSKRGYFIIYLTSTPFQLAPFLLKFLQQNGFPTGPVFMRWLGYGRFGHKWRVLKKVLGQLEPHQKVTLIGDSGEDDLFIFRRAMASEKLGGAIKKVLIRHVPGTDYPRTYDPRECVFNSLDEIKAVLANEVGAKEYHIDS